MPAGTRTVSCDVTSLIGRGLSASMIDRRVNAITALRRIRNHGTSTKREESSPRPCRQRMRAGELVADTYDGCAASASDIGPCGSNGSMVVHELAAGGIAGASEAILMSETSAESQGRREGERAR